MAPPDHAVVPFSEPPYLSGLPSPYYNESHLRWQKTCRAFISENLLKHAIEWEREETVPEHVFTKFAEANFLIPNLPAPLPVAWLKKLGIHEMPGGIKVEEWDYLHTAIYIDEVFDFLQHICVLCRSPADRYSDVSVRSFGARLVGHSGHGLWCPSYSQIRQSTIARTLYPRSAQRQEARLHCYYRTRCWFRCCKHSDLGYQVKGWQTLYYQRNKEMV